jgi:2-methylcitrate dehydratase PrpD
LESRRLAEVLATTSYEALPPNVIADTERAVLDWLGSALAGAVEHPARLAQTVVAGLGTSDDATVFAAGRSSAAGAALANGVASHILELDDVHRGSTLHPGAPVIPAALAVAEREHADGHAFVRAVALGYEAALRVGEAVNPSHYRFWHPTGTAATFGAAAAAGSLIGLDATQMLHALGSAGTQAAGLWEFNADGAMSKHLHPGKAAFNGVLSADLARAGFTGATRILEGERGFFRATSSGYDPTRISDGLGERWKISENCLKIHACCGHTHTAIDLALAFRAHQRWLGAEAADQVADVCIETYGPGFEIVKEMNPRSPYQAKFSIAYGVAAALLEGSVGLAQFTPERFDGDGVRTEAIAALLRRTRVAVRDDLTEQYPAAWPARLTLILRNGDNMTGEADFPRGNPEAPVSAHELQAKFRRLVGERFGDEVAERALAAARAVSQCNDVADVFREFASLAVPNAGVDER